MKQFILSSLLLCLFWGSSAQAQNKWYIRQAGQSVNQGPYTFSELNSRVEEGEIKPSDFAWSQESKVWIHVSQVRGIGGNRQIAAAATPPPLPEDANTDQFYVIPLLGFSAGVTNTTGGPWFTYGGELGYKFGTGRLGLYVDSFNNSTTISGVSASVSVTNLFLSFTNQTGVFYYGARLGLDLRAASATNGLATISASGSAFAFAPVVGLRIPVDSDISIAFDFSWITVLSGSISGDTVTVQLTNAGYLVPLVGAEIRF